jgi:myosin heavy subunit
LCKCFNYFISYLSKEKLGLVNGASQFAYLNKSECLNVEGIDDKKDFQDVLNAMSIIRLNEADKFNIFRLIAGILHLGNVTFVSDGHYAQHQSNECNLIYFCRIK